MAHFLFDAMTGELSPIDSQTVLAIQSFLESETVTTSNNEIVTETVIEAEEDIFVCGKCKTQFSSLLTFLNHKKEPCTIISTVTVPSSASSPILKESFQDDGYHSTNTCADSTSTSQASQLQIPTCTSSLGSNGTILLSEAELLSLTATLDHLNASAATDQLNQPDSPTALCSEVSILPLSEQTANKPSTSTASIQHEPNSHSSNTVELSLLTKALLNTPFLMSNSSEGPNESTMNLNEPASSTSVILTISPTNNTYLSDEKEKPTEKSPKKTTNYGLTTFQIDSQTNIVNVTTDLPLTLKQTHNSHLEQECSDENNSLKKGKPKEQEQAIGLPSKTNLKSTLKKCNFCQKSFSKRFDLEQHLRSHTGEKPFQCIVCGRAFAQKSNVKKHLETHKVWPNGLANLLPDASKNGSSQLDALPSQDDDNPDEPPNSDCTTFTENRNYACPYCKFLAQTYMSLKTHLKDHNLEKAYKCILPTCSQMFVNQVAFLDHVKTHESEMTYCCHLCNKSFKTLWELSSHQSHHNLHPHQGLKGGQRFYHCSHCLNKYSTPMALRHHMATSTHKYTCHLCQKVFPCERYLRRHLVIHQEGRKHKCAVCQKSFKTELYLKVHSITHSSHKPYVCKECGACFNRSTKLKRHALIHNPLKKYKCPFKDFLGCNKEFKRPDNLKAHILTHGSHARKKRHYCQICRKSFARLPLLRAHEKAEHSKADESNADNCLNCTECASAFDEDAQLKAHVCLRVLQPKFKAVKVAKSKNKCSNTPVQNRIEARKCSPISGNFNSEVRMEEADVLTSHIEIITTQEEHIVKL